MFEVRERVQFGERVAPTLSLGEHGGAGFTGVVLVVGREELSALLVLAARPTARTLTGLGPSLDDPESLALAAAHDGVHRP